MKETASVSKYRWIVLFTIFPVIVATEMMWLTIAPISSMASEFYGVSSLQIDMLSVSYMMMFIVFSIPASWVVDRFGYRKSFLIGASLTAVFGTVRAVFANQFTMVLIAQFFIAVGQPFLLNISTKVPANWFPATERSTAAGILTMAQYVGFAVPMIVSPMIVANHSIPYLLKVFAMIAVIFSVIGIIFTREKPSIAPPGPMAPKEDLSLGSLKKLFKNKGYLMILSVCFISMGIFNAILTLTEAILTPHGITSAQAGIVGSVFVVAGVIGAVVLPIISDKTGKRKVFFLGAIGLLVPAYLGFTFLHSYGMLLAVAGLAGFMIMGVAPILFQHGSEMAYPIQEGTSLGMILLMGQISGALFVYLFEVFKDISGTVTLPMLMIVALTAIELPIVARIEETHYHHLAEVETQR